MAWNQPDNGNKPGGNPWGKRPGGGNQPPGVDELLQKLGEQFKRIFGGDNGGDTHVFKIVAGGLLALWAVAGFYRVEQAERAVVTRFGEFHSVQTAGLRWAPPLVDAVKKVNVERVEQLPVNATMITTDENLVDISLSVQYRIADAKSYVLQLNDPESALAHATESALRHVVGGITMTQTLNEGRSKIATEVEPRLQSYLDRYQTGLLVSKVNVLEALPPKEVKASFDDVIRAKEDKERLKNQAMTYANGIVPEARGQAARLTAEAEGYKQEVVDRAKGDAARFNQLVAEYKKSPGVLRSRLYVETMEEVMGKTSKVVVEGNGNQMLYLPIDKLMAPSAPVAAPEPVAPPAASSGRNPRGGSR